MPADTPQPGRGRRRRRRQIAPFSSLFSLGTCDQFLDGDAALRFATSDTHFHPCSTLFPGTSAQTALLYWLASSYEIELRKCLCEHPEVWEIVGFFGPRKGRLARTAVAILLPAYDGADEHRLTIEVPTKGEPGMAMEYERVRRSRINRVHKYLASDTDGLQFAASTTGFHASEVRGTAAAIFSGARGPDLECRFLACVDPGTDPAHGRGD